VNELKGASKLFKITKISGEAGKDKKRGRKFVSR